MHEMHNRAHYFFLVFMYHLLFSKTTQRQSVTVQYCITKQPWVLHALTHTHRATVTWNCDRMQLTGQVIAFAGSTSATGLLLQSVERKRAKYDLYHGFQQMVTWVAITERTTGSDSQQWNPKQYETQCYSDWLLFCTSALFSPLARTVSLKNILLNLLHLWGSERENARWQTGCYISLILLEENQIKASSSGMGHVLTVFFLTQ